MFMEIFIRGQKLGKSRLSNTKLINFGYPVDIIIDLFQAVGQRILRQCIAYVLYFRNNNNSNQVQFFLVDVPFLVSMHFTIQNKAKIVLKF